MTYANYEFRGQWAVTSGTLGTERQSISQHAPVMIRALTFSDLECDFRFLAFIVRSRDLMPVDQFTFAKLNPFFYQQFVTLVIPAGLDHARIAFPVAET